MNRHITNPYVPAEGHARDAKARIRLPQLDISIMALRNRAYGTPACLLRRGRALIWQDSGHISPAGELVFQLGASLVSLAVDDLSALEPRLNGFESFVPSEACTALVEHALAPVLGLMERVAGAPTTDAEFRRFENSDRADLPRYGVGDDSFVRIGFVLTDHNLRPDVRGWMRARPRLWRSLDLSRAPALRPERHQAVPVSLSAQLGYCRLPLTELHELAVGDALRITPEVAWHGDSLSVRLIHPSGRFGCRARMAGDQMILQTSMDTLMDTSASPPPSTTADRLADDAFLSGVECDLSFELGSLRTTLGEVAKLRIGQSLRLGVHLQDHPVRILTGGRQIARGELAAVGDELVVVVTQTNGLPDI